VTNGLQDFSGIKTCTKIWKSLESGKRSKMKHDVTDLAFKQLHFFSKDTQIPANFEAFGRPLIIQLK
jgi:hypothetical protein